MADDEYAHPVGQVSKQLVEAGVKVQDQAEAARAAGDNAAAEALDKEATQLIESANQLDRADENYANRNKE